MGHAYNKLQPFIKPRVKRFVSRRSRDIPIRLVEELDQIYITYRDRNTILIATSIAEYAFKYGSIRVKFALYDLLHRWYTEWFLSPKSSLCIDMAKEIEYSKTQTEYIWIHVAGLAAIHDGELIETYLHSIMEIMAIAIAEHVSKKK